MAHKKSVKRKNIEGYHEKTALPNYVISKIQLKLKFFAKNIFNPLSFSFKIMANMDAYVVSGGK